MRHNPPHHEQRRFKRCSTRRSTPLGRNTYRGHHLRDYPIQTPVVTAMLTSPHGVAKYQIKLKFPQRLLKKKNAYSAEITNCHPPPSSNRMQWIDYGRARYLRSYLVLSPVVWSKRCSAKLYVNREFVGDPVRVIYGISYPLAHVFPY